MADQTSRVEAAKQRPGWYIEELTEVDDKTRALFEEYSKIPSDEVIPHIQQMRNKAFQVFPYPCLGRFRFLDIGIVASPEYQKVIGRVKKGDIFLDLGCCFGQDIRKLIVDGAPSENTYGSDLQLDFMEIGYDLFRDRATLKTKFIPGDVFDFDSPLKELNGKVDIIHASAFFHLWGWDDQVQAAKRCVVLLKEKPGSIVIGRQVANVDAGELAGSSDGKMRYRHNEESFERMWKLVGEETGTKWEVRATLQDIHTLQAVGGVKADARADFLPAGAKAMTFTVSRL